MRLLLLSPSLREHHCVVTVCSHKDEWEVISCLSLSALGVLYSNVNEDIRHGLHGSVRVGLESCIYGAHSGSFTW